MCYNFIWILNLKHISYHKIASLVGRFPLHFLLSLGSPRMRKPCRMAFLFLVMPFWGFPCFLLFLCLFSTLPFFSLCLSCLCSLSLRTLLLDSDFLWLSEFNFHFLKLIHLLIICVWRLGPGQKNIPPRLPKIMMHSLPLNVPICLRKLHPKKKKVASFGSFVTQRWWNLRRKISYLSSVPLLPTCVKMWLGQGD